jgi:HEAT repeat protein
MVAASGMNAARALAALVTSDPSPRVRKKAAWALGEIGAPTAVAGAALSRAAREDSDPLVRSLAAAALGRLAR